MNGNIISEKNSRIIRYLFLVAVLIVLHWNVKLNLSDDAIFAEKLKEMTIFQHMKDLYFNVNGKILPDTMAAIFTYLPSFIWKCVNIGVFVIIAISADKLFLKDPSIIDWIGLPVLLFPFFLLTSAGYCATSTNYVWCAAALLVALLPIRYLNRFSEKKYMYTICLLATVYAGNQEQSLAVLITVLILYILYCYWKKEKIGIYIYCETGLAVLCGAFMLTAPGHMKRGIGYSIFRTPDYLMLNGFQKLIRGFTSTAAYFLNGGNLIWPLFCAMLLMALIARKRDCIRVGIAGIVFAVSLFFGLLQDLFLPQRWKELFRFYPAWGYGMWDYKNIDAATYTEWIYYIPIMLSIMIIGIIYLEIFWIFGKEMKGIVLFLVLSAGFCTRLIMGFSPTIYGSSFRTFIYCYLAIGICVNMLYEEIMNRGGWFLQALCRGTSLLCVIMTCYISFNNIVV